MRWESWVAGGVCLLVMSFEYCWGASRRWGSEVLVLRYWYIYI